MEKVILSRQNLEAMSTQELIALADEFGIDIPADLNRNFIIAELLDIDAEYNYNSKDSLVLEDKDTEIATTLPKTYNDTKINIFLRNPVWLFAYWDIKESDLEAMKSDFDFEYAFIHISFYENEDDEKPVESFDVKIDSDNKELYILIPPDRRYVMANLACSYGSEPPKVLAYTKKIEIPEESEDVRNMQPGKDIPMSELTKISGMEELLHNHYLTHRQSFSN